MPSRDDRRLAKEQTKATKADAKAQAREQARAGKEAQKAAKAERKARKKSGGGEGGQEPLEPVPEPQTLLHRPRLELVLEPGPVKHLHWEAEQREGLPAEPEPAPTAPALAESAPASDVPLAGRRRTLYTTDHGNQVVAYERGGARQLAITEERGGRLEEVPFDESQVDRVVGAEPEPPAPVPLQETTIERPEPERKRGLFRRKAAEAPQAPVVVEHVYRPVEVVQSIPAEPQESVAAWEPTGALLETPRVPRPVRTARPAPRRTVRKAEAAPRKARKPRRKLVRKPARAYPGDNHPVIDIEGIGPVYAKKLEKMRITTTGLLDVAKPRRVAARLNVSPKTVRKWQAEAELIKVSGIGPQFAEALARSGIRGIDELKRRKPDDVARQVAKYLASVDQTVVGQPVTAKRVARWKRKAQPMRRVKVDLEKLAVPDHGIPPPWLRADATGKGARKAGTAKAAARGPIRRPGPHGALTKKQLAQRKYAARMKGVRQRAKAAAGGRGRIAKRPAATRMRRQLGLEAGR